MKSDICWPDALLLNRSTFMKGWSGQKHDSLYDELFDHYFDHPAEVQKMLEAKDTSFLWLSPAWFHSPKPLPSSSRGQVYLAQCKLPWKKSKINVAIRAVHDITQQCLKHVVGVTAIRSNYTKYHLIGLVSLAADATLEQWIPQVDSWTFQKIYRVALMTSSALRDLHHVNKVHPNLQPKNVLITRGQVELTDEQQVMSGERLYGRYPYFAPELRVDKRSNIYALGIILWQLASGVLFPASVAVCPKVYRIHSLKSVDRAYQDIFIQCLHKDPDQRPTADQVCHSLIHLLLRKNLILNQQEHSLEVRSRQVEIVKYLLHYRRGLALPALQDLMQGASLKKRMMIRATVSLELFYESKKDSCDKPVCGDTIDLPDWMQVGFT
ncbi:hypothetical protein G6F62_007841 [Rhizopus arrhizus]|nr:hypothetical protein G6F23_008488 [Rhizopus arrhizus]KAG0786358.1 hypothetical protein G6F22_007656 [Rhizopus arrhizus]KAG1329079.1 hypothetical protein G6F62_007841 [Rhizopus arrhizus]KAG1402248.1 hypothetical protein G6F58_010592 [Rhizopus delemar]